MGRWILDHALADLATLRATGTLPEGFHMWVNVSPRQIADLHFAELVVELTAAHQVPTLLLGLEIAEHAVRDVVTTENVLSALHELGVAVSVDDFGSGRVQPGLAPGAAHLRASRSTPNSSPPSTPSTSTTPGPSSGASSASATSSGSPSSAKGWRPTPRPWPCGPWAASSPRASTSAVPVPSSSWSSPPPDRAGAAGGRRLVPGGERRAR